MTKQEFLKLFDLEDVYQKYQDRMPFSFGYHDRLNGTKNFVFYGFENQSKIKLSFECVEFSKEVQNLDINFIIDSQDNISIDINELFRNEIFPFLTFDTNFDAALKFVADFINKVLIPKQQLIGRAHIH